MRFPVVARMRTKITTKTRVGTKVFDSWWPDRLGMIARKLKTRVWILWVDGETWKYDQVHLQFLRKL